METIKGKFSLNKITKDDGNIVECTAFVSTRQVIEGKEGFFNLEKNVYGDLVVKQYVILDGDTAILGEHK